MWWDELASGIIARPWDWWKSGKSNGKQVAVECGEILGSDWLWCVLYAGSSALWLLHVYEPSASPERTELRVNGKKSAAQ